MVKYGSTAARVVVGYETYLKRARKVPGFEGYKVWTEPRDAKIPVKAFCRIFIKGWKEPFDHDVVFDEYIQYKKDGNKFVPNKFWRKMPQTMIKKVVASQAFRLAFPDEMGGLPYCEAEIPKEEIKEADATATPVVTHVKMPERTDKPTQCRTSFDKKDVDIPKSATPYFSGGRPGKEPAKPAQPAVKYVSAGQLETLKGLCVAKNLDPDEIAHSYFGADSVKTLPANKAGMFMNEVSKIK